MPCGSHFKTSSCLAAGIYYPCKSGVYLSNETKFCQTFLLSRPMSPAFGCSPTQRRAAYLTGRLATPTLSTAGWTLCPFGRWRSILNSGSTGKQFQRMAGPAPKSLARDRIHARKHRRDANLLGAVRPERAALTTPCSILSSVKLATITYISSCCGLARGRMAVRITCRGG